MKIGKLGSNLIAMAFGGAGTVLGYNKYTSIKAQRDRSKGYIQDAYNSAVQRQGVHESDVRQGGAESLAARGLLPSGQQYASTSPSLTQTAYGGAVPSTLGGQVQADTNRELGLERHDLNAAHTRALNENNADYLNNLTGAVVGAGQRAASLYTMGAYSGASRSASVASAALPSASMTTSGDANEGSLIQGAFGIHPLTGRPQGTVGGYGQSNSDFHVG